MIRTLGSEGAGSLADARSCCSTRACCEASSGWLVSPIGTQLVERAARVDQSELEVVVLQRLDHRPRVQPQHSRQLRAGDAPLLAGGNGRLLEGGQQVPRPVHLDGGDQVPTQGLIASTSWRPRSTACAPAYLPGGGGR
ncbi:MAG: hypothetical protein U0797_14560 [Gemmataceae bacterium]